MMTTELQHEHELAIQQATNLDYSRWSQQQRQLKQPFDHETWQRVRDSTIADQQASNLAARNARLAVEAAAREEKRKADNLALDLEFEPQKRTLRNAWLADHPGKTLADFESMAWPFLKANLLGQREKAVYEATLVENRQRMAGLNSI